MRAFELRGNGRYGEAARCVGIAQAHDVEQELLFGGGLDRFVVLQPGLLQGLRAERGAGGQHRGPGDGHACCERSGSAHPPPLVAVVRGSLVCHSWGFAGRL